MRILVATTSYPSQHHPFAGIFVRRLHEAFCRQGCEVTTVTLRRHPGDPDGEFDPASGRVLRVGPRSGIGGAKIESIQGKFKLLRALRGMSSVVEAELPEQDALIAHWILPTLPFTRAARRTSGRPCLAVAHGGDLDWIGLCGGLRTYRRLFAGAVDGVWVCREDQRERVASALLARVSDGGPLGAPRPSEGFAESTAKRPDDAPVLFVGRSDAGKGLSILRSAMRSIDRPLMVIGASAEQHGAAARDREQIQWMGPLEPERVASLRQRASVCVVPSPRTWWGREEGWPIAAAEAIAAAKPLVATGVGGLRSAAGWPGVHLVSPRPSASELAAAIRAALQGPQPDPALVPTPDEVALRMLHLLKGLMRG